jgi:urease accessory protein
MNTNYKTLTLMTLGFLFFIPNFAIAHSGIDESASFSSGLLHPLNGLDHLLAMIAVGLWAVQLGGRAIWLLPLSFVLLMLTGGCLGLAGLSTSLPSMGVIVSILVFGFLLAVSFKTPHVISTIIVGIFALFHGHVHGSELLLTKNAGYSFIGFALATIVLHLAGIALGLSFKKWDSEILFRLSGVGFLFSGVYIFTV